MSAGGRANCYAWLRPGCQVSKFLFKQNKCDHALFGKTGRSWEQQDQALMQRVSVNSYLLRNQCKCLRKEMIWLSLRVPTPSR